MGENTVQRWGFLPRTPLSGGTVVICCRAASAKYLYRPLSLRTYFSSELTGKYSGQSARLVSSLPDTLNVVIGLFVLSTLLNMLGTLTSATNQHKRNEFASTQCNHKQQFSLSVNIGIRKQASLT